MTVDAMVAQSAALKVAKKAALKAARWVGGLVGWMADLSVD